MKPDPEPQPGLLKVHLSLNTCLQALGENLQVWEWTPQTARGGRRAHLGMFELQLCQLDEVLAEGGHATGLEIHELWRGGRGSGDPGRVGCPVAGAWGPWGLPCLAESERRSKRWQHSCWWLSAVRTSRFLVRALSSALLAFS